MSENFKIVQVKCPICDQKVSARKIVSAKAAIAKMQPHQRAVFPGGFLADCAGGKCSVAVKK